MKKVFLFNPTGDMAVANDTVSYTPPGFLRKFEEDVAPLMAFLGDRTDILISGKCNTGEFRRFWENSGVVLPRFSTFEKLSEEVDYDTIFPFPWSWNKVVQRQFTPFKDHFDPSFTSSANYTWKEGSRDFFSRMTSVAFMNEVREQTSGHKFISIPYSPGIISDQKALDRWLEEAEPPYVFKTPWSSSGRGLYPVTDEEFIKRCRIWVDSRLRQQGLLITEPWLNKKQDLSFQYYIHSDGTVRFLGVNFFEAGRVGEFKKEYVGMPDELKERLDKFSLPYGWIKETAEVLLSVLERSGYHEFYNGPIGIDGIFFEDGSGRIRIHPCIEINFRLNMGYVNLKLKDILHPEAKGGWAIRQFRPGEWRKFAGEGLKASPVRMSEEKILKGFLPLVPVSEDQLYGVWVVI